MVKTLEQELQERGFVRNDGFDRWERPGDDKGTKPVFLTRQSVELCGSERTEILALVDRQLSGSGWSVKEGDSVIYVDPKGVEITALVTTVFGPRTWTRDYDAPSLNLVYVSLDETRTDSYGRQVERTTSVVHEIRQYAHGSFWRLASD